MKYLITGGTGLIGKKLIAALKRDNNNEITVFTRNIINGTALLPDIQLISAISLADIESVDVVINLAGEPIADKRWTLNQKDRICQSRWSITEQLVSLINQANTPPSLFISGSAIGVYGRQNSQPINESFTGFHQEFSRTVCQQWEAIAQQVNKDRTRLALLRTGIVLDRSGGALAKMLPPFKLGLGGKISSGQQMMSWIHIDDMVAAILHIIGHQELTDVINMTSPKPVSNEVFSKTLANTLSRPALFTTPRLLLKLLFGEMADLLLYGQAVMPAKLVSTGFTFKYEKLDEALTQLLKQ